MGLATAVNNLCEDLADYASYLKRKARIVLLLIRFRRGIYITIILGHCLVPLMVLISLVFGLILYGIFGLFALNDQNFELINIKAVKNYGMSYKDKESNSIYKECLRFQIQETFFVIPLFLITFS